MTPMDDPGSSERVYPSQLAFASVWQVLGPFQIGTREAPWGADPLEYYGGFRSLEFSENGRFRSSLAPNATVSWSSVNASSASKSSSGAAISLDVDFPHVDWKFLQSVYGWSALQYQAWARGEIIVSADQTQDVVLHTDQILEFWLDGVRYFGGDMYAFRKAPPVLHLKPGTHRLDLRLIRDGRAMGSVGKPTIPITLELAACKAPLEAVSHILMPDVVDGKLAGSLGSVDLRNNLRTPITIHASNVRSADRAWTVLLAEDKPFQLAPGQTRPLKLILALESAVPPPWLRVDIRYESAEAGSFVLDLQKVTERKRSEPHKITFLHPGGIVSYAILRPPAGAHCGDATSAPVLLQFHGAGVDADSDMIAHSLDPVKDLCAWILFPSGVTPWSGDDWHSWGFADVEAAVSSIPSWIRLNRWEGIGVDTDRWLVSGHSNGGQGTWQVMTHRPDKIIAAVPVSGYTSIERYVPYEFWHPMDPRRQSILRAAINSYRHEMLAENCQGFPILQQHGAVDDNVPAYHSRLMAQMLSQSGAGSEYIEMPDANHWFDGIMTTDPLKDFYRKHVPQGNATAKSLQRFSMVVANPGYMGAKGGITITQLETPDQYGKMEVTLDAHGPETCLYTIKTVNVQSFRISPRDCASFKVFLDGSNFEQININSVGGQPTFKRTAEGLWQMADPSSQAHSHALAGTRHGRQLGAMDAILRSQGRFTIHHAGQDAFPIALQISRNLHQYFSADAEIHDTWTAPAEAGGNSILVAVGSELPPCSRPGFPIRVTGSGSLEITDSSGKRKEYAAGDVAGAIFLRPGREAAGVDERLELVVWGADADGLALAARLVPTMTGVSQPDFVVLGASSQWKGVEGALALGYLDHMWQVTKTAYLE